MIRDPSDGSLKKPLNGYDALKAKHGDNWGIRPPSEPEKKPYRMLTADQLREHYAKHGLGFSPKQGDME